MSENWTPAFPLASLPPGGARTFKHGEFQLAVFRPHEDDLYAIDNRCPHEGYPLARGHQFGGKLLMCAWHNFTFDLETGRCVAGDEDVRSYPVRVVSGQVQVDLWQPPPSEQIPRLEASLTEGLSERRMGQVARDVLRLLKAGVSPQDLLLLGLRYDTERAEFGSTHSLAVAEDLRVMLARFPGFEAVRPVMQLMDLASQPNVRRDLRSRPEPELLEGATWDEVGEQLFECGSRFQIERGEALLRGALEAGADREIVERWLDRLCVEHFGNFGHPLIYQRKVFEFLGEVGWGHATDVLPAHLIGVIGMARDEQIPAHSGFRKALEAAEGNLESWWAIVDGGAQRSASDEERSALVREILDGKEADALAEVGRLLGAGASPESIIDAILLAAGERLLRFDIQIDADPTVQEGWLDVTHIFTFADAVAKTLCRYRAPGVLRLLFYAAHFVHRMGPLDRPAIARQRRHPSCGSEVERDEVVERVRQRDPEGAVAVARVFLQDAGPADLQDLREALEDLVLDDHGNRAIFVAHYIKMLRAAFERNAVSEAHAILLGTLRFLASPIYERQLASLTNDAIRFVLHNTTPHRLTP